MCRLRPDCNFPTSACDINFRINTLRGQYFKQLSSVVVCIICTFNYYVNVYMLRYFANWLQI